MVVQAIRNYESLIRNCAVVGTKSITKEVKQGDMVIVDGITGDVIVDPTEDELIAYQNKRERFFEDKKNYKNYVI